MKQILQNLKNGDTEVAEVPCPQTAQAALLIQTSRTLVSAGTERMLVDFGKANLLDKARQQPDKVRMVIDKIKTDGLMPTIETVRNKLDQPLPLGYCNAGIVQEVGRYAEGFEAGDRVASNGKHAEMVCVPTNLCAKIPDNVSDDEAAFTVIGAIALQGIRLAKPTLGETVVVTGLGLIGLIAVQLLRAHGCRVLGLDFDKAKLELARRFGAEVVDLSQSPDPLAAAEVFSRGRGVDAVILTAATKSSEPVQQAAQMCRKRGRIILVGVTGLELSRADFYEKEITFQVSCSYGPGRYDPNYEEKGLDYPVGFVRWTEQRNFEAILDMMSAGSLDVKPLISHRFDIGDAKKAYELVAGSASSLGILLTYPENAERSGKTVSIEPRSSVPTAKATKGAVSFIGSGNYATAVLIPAFKNAGATLNSVASSGGITGLHAARKHEFSQTTTDAETIFSDDATDTVVITTRHDSHAGYILKALEAGKHIFVEKPLCLTLEQLSQIETAYRQKAKTGIAPQLMIGFNRRFAPQIQRIKKLLDSRTAPKSFIMTVNAGDIPADNWNHDKEIGGGRIIGEGCHFIDLLRFLADSPLLSYSRTTMEGMTEDTVSLQLKFENGSIGTVHYFANGPKSFAKERLEVFSSGSVLQLDNYRKLTGFNWPGFKKMNLSKQDKGQLACAKAFMNAVRTGGAAPIPVEQIFEVSRATIKLG